MLNRPLIVANWICLCMVPALCVDVAAHVGDRIIPIYEVPSSDIPQIDDFSLFEWENIVPEPSLESQDFSSLQIGSPSSDDLATRIYLAWNMATQRLYMGMQQTDDFYINEYAGGDPPNFFGADYVEFFVDGDHSGGQYACGPPDGTPEQVKLYVGAQAQRYAVIAEAPDAIVFGFEGFANGWASLPPWADVRIRQIGVEPTETQLELFTTPWDNLNWNGPDVSVRSVLQAHNIIGLQIGIIDHDASGSGGIRFSISSLLERPPLVCFAENFVDARLVPCERGDCTQARDSSVRADSWGRIKAGM
ncbi:MAG: hypothetical protein O2782_08065 [bacterium]|nr:hypothetical protein [bacterium]